MEWALDVLLYPDQADTYRLFRVESNAILDIIKAPLDEESELNENTPACSLLSTPFLPKASP